MQRESQGVMPENNAVATAAERLNGCEYGSEGTAQFWAEMKARGLVAVYGASDDLMEFNGAIYDEIGVYNGGTAYLTPAGLLEDKEPCCIHAEAARAQAVTIDAHWCVDGEPAWTYQTYIPHSTFEVMEDGEVYCRGIVFALVDAAISRATGEVQS